MSKKIFVPFIDGILNYDCRECGYSCCKYGAITLKEKEKKILLKEHAYLRYFFSQRTNKLYTLTKYPDCWFLENSGLCHIQKKYGYGHKPLICRVHPFYIARCRGEYIVLLDGCPGSYANEANKGIAHRPILKNARDAVNNNFITQKIDFSKKRLNLEKTILADSRYFLDNKSYLDFAAHQISLASKNKNSSSIKLKLAEDINLWKLFFKIDYLSMEDKKLTYELTALTPLLRVKSYSLRQMKEDKIPSALLAVYFYMILFSKNRRVRTRVQTYEQILNDMALNLLQIKTCDLEIKSRPVEDKLSYLRLLGKVRARK